MVEWLPQQGFRRSRGKQTPCEKKTQHVSRAHCISSCWSSCDVEMSPSSAYFFPSSHSFRSPSVKDVTDGSASLGKHPEVLYSVSLLIVQVEGQQHRLLATLSKCPALNCHLFWQCSALNQDSLHWSTKSH